MSLLIDALRGEKNSRPPFWFMRQAGRYLPEYRQLRARAENFLTLCYTPEMAVEATLQPIRRFGMDAAILFSDILVVPHALGMKLEFLNHHGPRLEAISTPEEIAALRREDFLIRLSPVFEAIEMLREKLPAETALIGFSGAPWTLACYMADGSSAGDFAVCRRWLSQKPEEFSCLIGILTDCVAEYLKQQIRCGAQAVQIFDSWAGLLDAMSFRRYAVEPARKIVAEIRKEFPRVPVIGFPRQCGAGVLAYAEETGVDAVSLDYTFDAAWAAAHVQPLCGVQGNLDPMRLLAGGRDMEAAARQIMSHLANGKFIFNLGHGMLPDTPVENVEKLCRIIRGEA